MKKWILVVFMFVVLTVTLSSQCFKDEKENVKHVILKAYVEGIKSLGDIEQIKKGFHPDFTMLYNKKNNLNRLTLANWIKYVEKGKNKYPNGLKEKPVVKFHHIDITGNAAVVKFDLTQKGITSTDYMFLLKFNEGWRIVSKIFHFHKKEK